MPMKSPPHPGDFIRTEIIEPAGFSVTAAAAALNVSRPALSSLLNSKADLSGDMALRLEKAFGVKMDTLRRMHASYDIAQTRKRRAPPRGARQASFELRRASEGGRRYDEVASANRLLSVDRAPLARSGMPGIRVS
jgi:addiction module HigA family antidote